MLVSVESGENKCTIEGVIMKRYRISDHACERILKGERLIFLEDFDQPDAINQAPDGMVFFFSPTDHSFTGQAIVSRQHKGFAWVFSLDSQTVWCPEWLEACLDQAIAEREPLFTDQSTNAFRLFNGEGDGMGGVTIDWYNHFLHINWYSRGAFYYRDWWITGLESLIKERGLDGIYETKRFELNPEEEAFLYTGKQDHLGVVPIKENGVNYEVTLGKDWMTGIFLDQREVRRFVKDQADQLEVLNLFSYAGAFSVAAAVGGARSTTSVDIANRSIELTQANMKLNGQSTVLSINNIVVMDVFDYIAYAKRKQLEYDMIICDPPSFARSKKRTFSALTDYEDLARDLFEITRLGGFCIVSTNHSRFYKEQFVQIMNQAAQGKDYQGQLIQSFDLPADFPTSADAQSQYLKVLVYYKMAR